MTERLHARTVPLAYGPDPLQFDGSPTVLFDRPGLTLVGWGTALLVPAARFEELARALFERALGAVDPRDPRGGGLSSPLVLLPAEESNGLEFDSVVVVEPALIAAGGSGDEAAVGDGPPGVTTRGLRTLYVALTRPTRRLAVVASLPLPAGLDAG